MGHMGTWALGVLGPLLKAAERGSRMILDGLVV
jgi:hypothetical protein